MAKSRFRILGFRFVENISTDYRHNDYFVRIMHKSHYGNNDWIWFYQHVKTNTNRNEFIIDNALFEDENIYGTKDLAVGVCAIVGQNGSGKSTILDMMIRVLNNVAATLVGEDFLYSAAEHLHYIQNVYGAILYLQGDDIYQLLVEGGNVSIIKYDRYGTNNGSRYVESNSRISLLREETYNPNALLPLKPNELQMLESLFYSVVTNYSIYAYYYNDYYQEATEEDKLKKLKRKPQLDKYPFEQFWMTGLFHKNDGYQTPIVINPMRHGGRIDAPKENNLAKERILSLLFVEAKDGSNRAYHDRYPFRVINGNLHIMALALSYRDNVHNMWTKEWMRKKGLFGNGSRLYTNFDLYSNYIIGYFKEFYGIDDAITGYSDAARYLVYKIIKIGLSYLNYNCIISNMRHQDFSQRLLYDHLNRLMKDDTHITVKLRRTILYLIFGKDVYKKSGDLAYRSVFELKDLEPRIVMAMNEFNSVGMNFKAQKEDFLPPPIFDVEFRMIKRANLSEDDSYTDGDIIQFCGLSSGERQIAYSMSNFAYHLVNINSVWKSKTKKVGRAPLLRYGYINAIFDEIELYYHPELQRRFLCLVLNTLRDVNLDNIKGVNIMLVTHSPFVLSDIPRSNVLALGESPSMEETFCANIHEMLNQSFFMQYTMGEVSQQAIEAFFREYRQFSKMADKRGYVSNISEEIICRYKYLAQKVADEYLRKTIIRMLDEMLFYRQVPDTKKSLEEKIREAEVELNALKERYKDLEND